MWIWLIVAAFFLQGALLRSYSPSLRHAEGHGTPDIFRRTRSTCLTLEGR
ncbi:hypothetical protein [Hyalangium sp.]|nr:hypothetical protein [Hyalangium sp.]HYH97288.1 hypothetical protein [Hyalangium sp.]